MRRFPLLFLCAAIFSCSSEKITSTGPARVYTEETIIADSVPALRLYYCPRTTTIISKKMIGPEGGKIESGAFDLEIPAGALPDSQMVVLTRPAGDYLVADAHIEGYSHYIFALPVQWTVNIGAKCPVPPSETILSAVWLDSPTGFKVVSSRTDHVLWKVKFESDHFSSYGIAW
jgi:hypothetical protein